MRILFISVIMLIVLKAQSQQGFKKTYTTDSTGSSFVDILWDGEKLIATGQYLSAFEQLPNGALNGLLYIELDTNGNTLHTDIYFEPNDAVASGLGNSIVRLSDGRILVLTQALYDTGSMMNIYQDGILIDTKKYDFLANNSHLYNAKEIHNGLLLSGYFQNLNYELVGFLIKADKNGNKIWERHYGIPGVRTFGGNPILIDNNTILIPSGISKWNPPEPILNYWQQSRLIIVDSLGNIKSEWFSPKNTEGGMGKNLLRLPNGNWLYTSFEFIPLPGQIDDWATKPKIICRDSNLNLVWEKYLSHFLSFTNRVGVLTPAPDGNYVVLGRWDGYEGTAKVHKFAPDGDSIWTFTDICEPFPNCDYELGGMAILPSGSIYIAGTMNDFIEPKSMAILIKLSKDGCLDTITCGGQIGIEEKEVVDKIKVFPNPATGFVNIENPIGKKVELFDLQGRKMKEDYIVGSAQTMDISNLEIGVYLLKMQVNKLNLTYKIIKH